MNMTEQTSPISIPASGESNFTIPDYGLDPADSALAREIEGFDLVGDTSGPVSLERGSNFKLPDAVSVNTLPPHLADPIKAELARVSPERRAALEQTLVAQALTENSMKLRIKMGPGANSNAYQREVFQQANEQNSLADEALQIETELAKVTRWENFTDPVTGKVTPKAIESVSGDRRARMQQRLREIDYHLQQLQGREGKARLAKALKEAVDQKKAMQQQLAEDAEARALADKMLREERVADRAKAYAKNRRNTLGG
jgi:hypothetical protein